jgi:hypothetical protein
LKSLLPIPIVLLLVAGGCYGASAAMGWKAHGRELLAAAIICLVSGELAMLPVTLMRKSDAVTVSQAGLAGTVIHMLLTLLMAAVMWMQRFVDRGPFLFLLLAFFWISLIAIVLATARLVRAAAARTAG